VVPFDWNRWWTSPEYAFIDMPELGIPIRMIVPLLGLAVALQTVI